MTLRRLALAALLWAGCRGHATAPDAGTVVRRAIDLRSAFMATLPEWRNINLEGGSAVLRREVSGDFDAARVAQGFVHNGFLLEDGGTGLEGRRDRFVMVARQGSIEWRMALKADDPDRLIAAPNVMSTENMATWFPPGVGEEQQETFTLSLAYTATPARIDFVTRQLYSLTTRGSWDVLEAPGWPDAGQMEQWSFALRDRASGATLRCRRDQERVSLEYRLITFERR